MTTTTITKKEKKEKTKEKKKKTGGVWLVVVQNAALQPFQYRWKWKLLSYGKGMTVRLKSHCMS